MTTRVSQQSPQVLQPTSLPLAPASPATVKEAEKLLKRAGFNPGKVDGKPTPALENALREFQGAVGLPATGTVDTATLARLRKVGQSIAKHHAKGQDEFCSIGQKSKRIQNIEKQLTRLGYDVGKVDGVYSQQTAAAVKAFKADQPEIKNNGGFIGAPGQKVLAREVKQLQHAPERRRLAPTKAQSRLDAKTAKAVSTPHADGSVGLAEGSRGASVKNVQRHLKAAGFDPQHTNGVFDERTGAALKAFQKRAGLPVTGVADPATWKELKKSFILSKKPAAPAQARGERSGAVKASEKLLKQMGFNPGKVDGLFDRRTERAVKAFEKKHHLKRDGTISAGELAKMKKVASGSGFANKVLGIAKKWLGFHEGAGNRNPFSSYFGRGPEAWCADFVSYCYTKAGKKLNEPWTPALLAKLQANGTANKSHPKPGDIVMFDWAPGSGPSSNHTGLVEKVYRKNGRTYVQTIEGNSSDMVRRNTYVLPDNRLTFGTIR